MPSNSLLILGLAGWSAVFLAVGLRPYRFRYPDRFVIYLWPTPINGPLNFLCFLPFGVLLSQLSFLRSPIVVATVYCFLLSLCVETAQLFLPRRYASIADVTLNTLGGFFGAALSIELTA